MATIDVVEKSRAFMIGGGVAVKVIDPRGNEMLSIHKLGGSHE